MNLAQVDPAILRYILERRKVLMGIAKSYTPREWQFPDIQIFRQQAVDTFLPSFIANPSTFPHILEWFKADFGTALSHLLPPEIAPGTRGPITEEFKEFTQGLPDLPRRMLENPKKYPRLFAYLKEGLRKLLEFEKSDQIISDLNVNPRKEKKE